jgi:integrase
VIENAGSARSDRGTDHRHITGSVRCSRACPADHALVGLLGLRVSEACHADITDIRYESGYELLRVIGKGAKPADIRCRSRSCAR